MPRVKNVCERGDAGIPETDPTSADRWRKNIRSALLKLYWRMERVLVPGHRYSQSLYEDVLNAYVTAGVTWLDIGCGHSILPAWRANEEKRLLQQCRLVAGIDYSLDSLRQHATLPRLVNGDVTSLPFTSGAFRLVTANMVVEHLRDPEAQFREIHRVLEPGGVFLFHTPNLLGYTAIISRLLPERLKKAVIRVLEGRGEEDVFPTFYRANRRTRIEELATMTGFDAVDVRMTLSCANFTMCPPFALPELLWIRILRTRTFKPLRTNIIAVLRKRPANRPTAAPSLPSRAGVPAPANEHHPDLLEASTGADR